MGFTRMKVLNKSVFFLWIGVFLDKMRIGYLHNFEIIMRGFVLAHLAGLSLMD